MLRTRCAIYTRKSSEEGLEQDFNSLDAQREACEAYIASQKREGWEVLPDRFDDGGISGGHLDRPALHRLMEAVDAKRVDQIVVYKIDRLTRSLADFAKLVDRLDAAEASFVSVTQSFNTATSMGRLTLNVLVSFAQFEREVTAERIRDKIAASKRKGLWMGGNVPIGYVADGRTLKIKDGEAETIRMLYELYQRHGALRKVRDETARLGLRTRERQRGDGRVMGGGLFDRGHIHHILTNPIYAGRIRHKTKVYEGQHPAIIDPGDWDALQQKLMSSAATKRGRARVVKSSPLLGKLFDETGDRLTPSHSRKAAKRLRYYISSRLVGDRSCNHPDAWRLPAEQLERLVCDIMRSRLSKPGAASRLLEGAPIATIHQAEKILQHPWQRSAVLDLIERVDLRQAALTIGLSVTHLAEVLMAETSALDAGQLIFEAPFQSRRRGVELKLTTGMETPELDRTLVSNIVKAQRWLSQIIEGKSFGEIAKEAGTSKQRIQDLIGFAMLNPEMLEDIAAGTQPIGLTTEHLIRSGIPCVWEEQRRQFAKF